MDRTPKISSRRRRPLALLAAAAGVLAFASPASAAPAVATDAAMATAAAIARAQWGTDPCGGQVTVSWTILAPQVNATSTWSNPVGGYADPTQNSLCKIEYNELSSWDWPKLCTVVVHEIGHLDGHDHSADPGDVMAPYYAKPLPACDTPGPGVPPVSAAPVTPAAGSAGTATSSSTTKSQVKAAKAPKVKAPKVKAPKVKAPKVKAPKATKKTRTRKATTRAKTRKATVRKAAVRKSAVRSARVAVITREA